MKDEKIEELDLLKLTLRLSPCMAILGRMGGAATFGIKGIPYTGSGVDASKIAMDKLATKKYFVNAGLKTPDYLTVTECGYAEIQRLIIKFGLPVVLKPRKTAPASGYQLSGISIALSWDLQTHLNLEVNCLSKNT